MMSREQVEWYRRLTPKERTRLMLELMDLGWSILRRQGPKSVRLAIEAINREHAASRSALVQGLERGEEGDGQASRP